MFTITFYPLFGSWLLAALLLFLAAGGILLFSPASERLSGKRRRVILLLRFGVLLVTAFLFLRPTIHYQQTRRLPATLLLLTDCSESMSVKDEPNNRSRFERLTETLAAGEAALGQFEDRMELRSYRFDLELAPLENSDGKTVLPSEPRGTGTAIGSSLFSALNDASGRRLLGAVLLSDGTQRSRPPFDRLPQDAAFRCRDLGIPLYTVCFGGGENVQRPRDAAVIELSANDRVFAGNELTVAGEVRLSGFAGESVPLVFEMESAPAPGETVGKMTKVGETILSPKSDEAILPFRLTQLIAEPGERKFTVSIAPQPGELLTRNNEQSGFVQVVDGSLSVLYLEGTRRFEQKFLRRAVESSAEIKIDYWRSAPNTAVKVEGKSEAERIALETAGRPSLVETYFAPGRYSAYILGNIDSSAFKTEELQALAERVADGAGLIALGGERTLSPGGYAASPLVDLFPVVLDERFRMPLNLDPDTFERHLAPNEKIHLPGPFQMLPTDEGMGHYLTQLGSDSEKSLAVWRTFLPLSSAYRTGPVKPGARTLLSFYPETGAAADPIPALLIHLFGRGRVALLATDETWRWAFGGFASEHDRFWRQLILWSAQRDRLREGELAVRPERKRLSQHESLDFTLAYRPASESNPNEFTAAASVITPDGREISTALTRLDAAVSESGDLRFTGSFTETGIEGDYRIRATVRKSAAGDESESGDQSAAESSAESRFLVFARNPELDNPVASRSVMANLAEVTGGRAVEPDDFADLLRELAEKKESLIETREIRRTLYDTLPVFILFLIFLTAEWFLRKHWGMV